MRAVVLAGGLGSRLRTLVPDLPKALAPVGDRAFIDYVLSRLRDAGITEAVLCLGHRAQQIVDYLDDCERFTGLTISYSIEDTPRGTAGALKYAVGSTDEQFLVVNGDSYHELDVSSLFAFHAKAKLEDPAVVATMVAVKAFDINTYGLLTIAPPFRLAEIRTTRTRQTDWINAGFYLFERDILEFLPEDIPSAIESNVIPAALKAGRHICVYCSTDFFVDIGTPSGYGRFLQYLGETSAH